MKKPTNFLISFVLNKIINTSSSLQVSDVIFNGTYVSSGCVKILGVTVHHCMQEFHVNGRQTEYQWFSHRLIFHWSATYALGSHRATKHAHLSICMCVCVCKWKSYGFEFQVHSPYLLRFFADLKFLGVSNNDLVPTFLLLAAPGRNRPKNILARLSAV